jgi:glucan phosphoethanolaminetransferase (alkaline phosphatase superfamily)
MMHSLYFIDPIRGNNTKYNNIQIWLFVVLSTILLLISNQYSAKPILIIILFSSAMVSYFTNNYGTIFD